MAQRPQHTTFHHLPQFEEQGQLHIEMHGTQRLGRGECLDLFPQRHHIEHIAHRDPGTGYLHHAHARVFSDAMIEGDTRDVHHLVAHLGGDDLAPQAVLLDGSTEPLAQRGREIGPQCRCQVGVVGHVRRHQQVDVGELRIGQQHGELGSGEPAAHGLALSDLLVGGQELERPVDPAVGLERMEVASVHVHHGKGLFAGNGKGERLRHVVGQHHVPHVVGHRHQEFIACLGGERSRCHGRREKDLDVHLVVAAIDARGVVDGIGVDESTGQRVFDAPALGEPQVAALGHHATAQVGTIHTHRIVGTIAHLGVRLGGGLHVGADSTVPEQVDWGAQDGRDQFGRGERRDIGSEGTSSLGRQVDALQRSRIHTAARGDERGVVVGPTAAR